MHHPIFLWLSGVVLFSVSSCAGLAGREKYETPKYSVVVSDDAFEVRDYPAVVVVSTSMGAGRSNQNSGFMSLFRYISGDNEQGKKIAMTTPVIGSKNGDERKMSFVVPAEVVKAGVPPATDENVVVSKRPAGRFAVYRYSGRWSEAREGEARKKLQAWLEEKGYATKGSFEKANYDPPFTLPSMRRNEVMIRLAQ